MKTAILLAALLVASPALADGPPPSAPAPTAPPDPVITLRWSELQALLAATSAEAVAAPVMGKIRAQMTPPAPPSPPPSPPSK